eukprot:TRINITY_DN689_c0_g2_i3.p1 TRINITY_DN689_c0_g2~~TRINITY_DN689_c0_g2_i3.p1  ORF type:complete len:580 (-),score=128.77 TRINITY_DN689_c0_g2_i3:32-1771(-)
MSQRVQPPLLCGWLKKRGAKGLLKSAKKRYLKQNGKRIEYSIDKDSASLQGYIDLELVTKIEKSSDSTFNLVTPDRTYELETCPDGPNLDYWLNGFMSWINYFRAVKADSLSSNANAVTAVGTVPKEKLLKIIEIMKKPSVGLDIKDRKYVLKTYRLCFVGKEYVDWVLSQNLVSSRDDGTKLGQVMMNNRLLHHVTDEHNFKDENLFYRFLKEDGTDDYSVPESAPSDNTTAIKNDNDNQNSSSSTVTTTTTTPTTNSSVNQSPSQPVPADPKRSTIDVNSSSPSSSSSFMSHKVVKVDTLQKQKGYPTLTKEELIETLKLKNEQVAQLQIQLEDSQRQLQSLLAKQSPTASPSTTTLAKKREERFWRVLAEDRDDELNIMLNQGDKFDIRNRSANLSLLHFAISNNSVKIIPLLINAGTRVNEVDCLGQTPLMYAIEKLNGEESYQVVKQLVDAGADVELGDTSDNMMPPLHAACVAGNYEVVNLLIEAGADIQKVDGRLRWTTLHWAVVGGSLSVVKLLIQKGVEFVVVQDENNSRAVSPLHLAEENDMSIEGKKALIQVLREAHRSSRRLSTLNK